MAWILTSVLLLQTALSKAFSQISNGTLIPEVQHVAYFGVTRHGKTEACISRNAPRMREKNRPAFLVLDPPGGMAKKIATYLAMYGIPFLSDKVADTNNTLGYGFCPRSTNPDPDQQEAENRQTISDVISVLVRTEGKTDTTKTPMIHQGLTDALLLFIYQKEDVPFHVLKNCFIGETDEAQYLLKNCTNPDIVLRFELYHKLTGNLREQKVGAAERRLQRLCDSPQFRKRSQPTFDLAAYLNGGGILMLDGSSQGNLSREDAGTVMGMVLLLVIALARAGKLKRKVVVCIDEGLNTGLVDLNVARALREAAKWGLEFHLLIQNPTFTDQEIGDSILNNCDVMYFFKQVNPAAARVAAEICGTMTLDPMRVKEIKTHIRQVHTGEVDIQNITHTSVSEDEEGNKRKTISEGHIAIPRYEEKPEHEEVRYGLGDQVTLMIQKMMLQYVGYCIIKYGTSVIDSGEQLPMLQMPKQTEWPWQLETATTKRITLGERKLAVYLEFLKSLPAYKTPKPFVCTPPKKSRKSVME